MRELSMYQGFTQRDLTKRFDYNPESGEFTNRKTGQLITTTKGGRLVIGVRTGHIILTLSPAKLAYMIMENRVVGKGEMVRFKDGDPNNLIFSNLSIIKKRDNTSSKETVHYYTTDTPTDGVVELHSVHVKDDTRVEGNVVFVVRRGTTQAVYRTGDYDLAVKVRKEWEADKNIHRWDMTMTDQYMPQEGIR